MVRGTTTIVTCMLLAGCGPDDGDRIAAATAASPFLGSAYPDGFSAADVELSGALIARGDSVYHGVKGRGNCYMCHGPFLRGSTEGTNLRDDIWHNGDGSLAAIDSLIRTGVSRPQHMTMPPRGGMPLTDNEVRALAAYVYWSAQTRTDRLPE